MNINELEKRTGITKQNIRFYEKRGLLNPSRNTVNNYREYTEADVEILQVIKILRKLDIPIDDIRQVLEKKSSLESVLQEQLRVLQSRQKELDAGISMCRSLLHTSLDELDASLVLEKMDELEREGGTFMMIMNDYKKLVNAEMKRTFSFAPDNMALTPSEFSEALFQYAKENNLNLVITKESMYPVFEIDGVEYIAERHFGRFGARIKCRMTHPEELEKEIQTVPARRRKVFRILYGCFIPAGLLLYFMAISGSVSLGILMGICMIPILIWTFQMK